MYSDKWDSQVLKINLQGCSQIYVFHTECCTWLLCNVCFLSYWSVRDPCVWSLLLFEIKYKALACIVHASINKFHIISIVW